ncbi:rhamnosyl/mannosyltransferase [Desulfobaculum xiamenense]|uniref:Rhamnosyl/mannosyltransferase n=1 Tax=Desulfobaculum xiamenense TaxID=995050 RepID=A0A846QQM8_9BACT|nr:glycosyltransferase [Desulfobaculum xiamenense]NJB68663.1 rhamnosyl/mannosyltransferase [Desulfobaculum xiamenense]
MRILHLGKYYAPHAGGIENFVADLAREQVRGGDEVMVLAHGDRPFAPPLTEVIHGVLVRRVRTFGTLVHTPLSPGFGWELARALRSFRPDVVHAHVPNVSAFWMLLARKSIPLVLHWHSDVVPSAHDAGLRRLYAPYAVFERMLLERADAVIATSAPYMQTSAALRRVRGKCRVVPLGVAPERVEFSLRERDGAGRGRVPMVLAVGRFAYYKGFEHLVHAMRGLEDARLVIAGDGPMRGRVEALVDALELGCRVSLPGRVSDEELRRHWSEATVFCLPSIERTEAFGVAMVEAMAYGLPVVSTDIPGSGVGFVNHHGVTGLVVPPGDASALADAIGTLLDDAAGREAMGRAARKRFDEFFHIGPVRESVSDVYGELLGHVAMPLRQTAEAR